MSLYENQYYTVVVNTTVDGYEVINKETGVVEYRDSRLPHAIIAAKESMDYFDRAKAKEEEAKKKAAAEKAVPDNVVKAPFGRGD